jgi:hypothetical protein
VALKEREREERNEEYTLLCDIWHIILCLSFSPFFLFIFFIFLNFFEVFLTLFYCVLRLSVSSHLKFKNNNNNNIKRVSNIPVDHLKQPCALHGELIK